ncbi:motility protein [Leptospira gomenensis]|uniref:Motility protein n=2 Tax=Leptospira gomenensis TaxID=2484974 RepID=A0A5F1Y7V2_9LEPT|nr:motility protein [Leptospira gomenensis]TGK33687.1 motility protein [Leptospira gomenensis]TGK44929.1 motility protein [Leptospira gomenensis]TGK64555.1 motility protein [Leptospira gomenensis]
MSAFYVFAGINHFLNPSFYLRMMPPYLPAHNWLNWISGCAEIVLGAALLFPSARKLASYGVILLLILVFPANVYMLQAALSGENFGVPLWGLFVRLPFQLVFIAWAWFVRDAD